MYTPDGGHQHGEAQGPGGPPGRQSTSEVIVYTPNAGHQHVEAKGPGKQSTPEVRDYKVYTPDAGYQHREAQGPRGPPGRQRTPEVREHTCTLTIHDTYMEKLRVPEGLQVTIHLPFPSFITQHPCYGPIGWTWIRICMQKWPTKM